MVAQQYYGDNINTHLALITGACSSVCKGKRGRGANSVHTVRNTSFCRRNKKKWNSGWFQRHGYTVPQWVRRFVALLSSLRAGIRLACLKPLMFTAINIGALDTISSAAKTAVCQKLTPLLHPSPLVANLSSNLCLTKLLLRRNLCRAGLCGHRRFCPLKVVH